MHSIVMLSSPAFLKISSFIASPTSCYSFLPSTMLQSPLRKTRYPDAEISEVPSLLVSCIPMTSQPMAAQLLSRVSMWPIPLTAAVRTLNVPNVSLSSRDLALAALCLLRADFPPPASPVAYEQIPSTFHSFPGASYPDSCLRSSDVLGTALPPRLDFSIVDTSAYSRVSFEHSSSPRFGSHVFRGGGVPNLLPQARLPWDTISLCLLGGIIASRCCWQACTVSIDKISHQSMSWNNIDSCENSIARTPKVYSCRAVLTPDVSCLLIQHNGFLGHALLNGHRRSGNAIWR